MHRLLAPLLFYALTTTALCSEPLPIWNALTPQQQEILSAGKPFLLEEEVPGNPWPRYTVYHLVKSSPEQAAAVFWDCELDPKYVPNCLSVRLVASPQPWIHDGQYTLKMPLMLPSEVYVSRNELKKDTSGYEISWNVLHARYIMGSTGKICFEPHGEMGEQTLIRYTNLVKPGSSIAGLLRANASKQVLESVRALVRQIESELSESPQLMEHQLKDLEKDSPPMAEQ
jgi:hypothetical protein